MRLINTTSLKLEFFPGTPPPYAILSHTWGPEEVTLQDFGQPHATSFQGWNKIAQTCRLAKEGGIDYAWVDTCCIDKTSSAELSEAINSMYAWYRAATIAYAILEDWKPAEKSTKESDAKSIEGCRWFTRGWTLQELIAPSKMEFYDLSWTKRGTKTSLVDVLSEKTGIWKKVLSGERDLDSISVAARMAWAAGRECTRGEDVAYSLLGIFGVNLPMLYGEGKDAAFVRLQEEIMGQLNDLTLFAWKTTPDRGKELRGVMAHDPSEFANVGSLWGRSLPYFSEEFTITNKGIKVNTGLADSGSSFSLRCFVSRNGAEHEVGILLKKIGSGLYVRKHPHRLVVSKDRFWEFGPPEQFYLARDLTPQKSEWLGKGYTTRSSYKLKGGPDHGVFRRVSTEPRSLWDEPGNRFLSPAPYPFRSIVGYAAKTSAPPMFRDTKFWVVCGKEPLQKKPWVLLTQEEPYSDIDKWLVDTQGKDFANKLSNYSNLNLFGYLIFVELNTSEKDFHHYIRLDVSTITAEFMEKEEGAKEMQNGEK